MHECNRVVPEIGTKALPTLFPLFPKPNSSSPNGRPRENHSQEAPNPSFSRYAMNNAPSIPQITLTSPWLQMPPMHGIIDRRMLVNFRCAPEILARWLPPPFRPRLVRGWGLAGLCLIRLRNIRPRGWPSRFGVASENAAHRIAVEWDEEGEPRQGVFVLRRDTNSRWNVLGGGRLFPGVHHQAQFKVWETSERFKLTLHSKDKAVRLRVVARRAETWPAHSLFPTLAEASDFFANGRLGWSETHKPGQAEALLLQVEHWAADTLIAERVESSFFDDPTVFPPGSIALDNILLQRGLEHEWHALGCAECGPSAHRLGTMRPSHEPDPHPACGHPLPSDGRGAGGEGTSRRFACENSLSKP